MKSIRRKFSLQFGLFIFAFVLLVFLGGCADFKKTFGFTSIDEDGTEAKTDLNFPAKNLLEKGMDDYNVGKYFTAIEFFQEILNRYPFSPEAPLAELKAADCSYHLERYQEALVLYDEFANRHPTNESIPYVLFQKGMSNFKQIDRVDRDTSGAAKSIEFFKQLLKSYPNSPYTNEAKARIAAASEFLADHEFFVAEYYVRAEKYDQAKVRLKYLIAKYPEKAITIQAKELLARLEAGDPPKSILTSWLPKFKLQAWPFSGQGAAENTSTD
ncbi:MAG: outer membrane protein assembly factor BamD [Proteobacteria bacterium]|nr:outer membrane protein assembly factor BamD [Pseudomonadota bacterium]